MEIEIYLPPQKLLERGRKIVLEINHLITISTVKNAVSDIIGVDNNRWLVFVKKPSEIIPLYVEDNELAIKYSDCEFLFLS